ncbi:hypothetical protein O5155_16695, partial [Escherichia coli]|nr:hypothetical protein [Escherichia coli]MCZ6302193.1 hypothetical protein [Escherichia coli]
INGAIFRFMVLNTPSKAETAPVSHADFLCPFFRYGRVARIPKNSRKAKDAGRTFDGVQVPDHPAEHRVI